MPTLPSGVTQEQFYGLADTGNRTDLQGGYQYVSLKDIVNNFLIMYTGTDQLIPATVARELVIFHAKRGLQELTFDALREIRALEAEINPNTLTWILPDDFVREVRVSWVDNAGLFHPIVTNFDTIVADNYLQDNLYNPTFDTDPLNSQTDGSVLLGSDNTYDQTNVEGNANYYIYLNESTYGLGFDHFYDNRYTGRFGVDTSKANYNGWYVIDRANGIMKFSSNIGEMIIVIEYIADGLQGTLDQMRIHKFAEEALYMYIRWNIVRNRFGVQEYIVKRAMHDYDNARRQTKLRLSGIKYDDVLQWMRGRDKRLK